MRKMSSTFYLLLLGARIDVPCVKSHGTLTRISFFNFSSQSQKLSSCGKIQNFYCKFCKMGP